MAAGHRARPFTRLGQLLRPERRDIAAVVVFAVAVAVLSLATPIAAEGLVNTVAFGVLVGPVVVIALVLGGCLGLAAAVRAMQIYVAECLQRRLFVRVVADYAGRLPRAQLRAFDAAEGPELANRFFDVLTLQKAVALLLLGWRRAGDDRAGRHDGAGVLPPVSARLRGRPARLALVRHVRARVGRHPHESGRVERQVRSRRVAGKDSRGTPARSSSPAGGTWRSAAPMNSPPTTSPPARRTSASSGGRPCSRSRCKSSPAPRSWDWAATW